MIKLRRFYSPAELRDVYAAPYDHTKWDEHVVRVRRTIDVTQRLIDEHELQTVADLSCGDAAVIKGLHRIAYSIGTDFTGGRDINEGIATLAQPVDLFICTETIEHLEAPWTVLERIAQVTKFLVLSTPLDEDPTIGNHEHYWSFTKNDVESMLVQAGFATETYTAVSSAGWTYTYQLWTARSTLNA